MNQFIEGLNVLGVLHMLRNHPVEARDTFQYTSTLTAELIDGLFTVKLSPEESNKKANEKTILFYWNQLLEDIEQGIIKGEVYDSNTASHVIVNISLQYLLIIK